MGGRPAARRRQRRQPRPVGERSRSATVQASDRSARGDGARARPAVRAGGRVPGHPYPVSLAARASLLEEDERLRPPFDSYRPKSGAPWMLSFRLARSRASSVSPDALPGSARSRSDVLSSRPGSSRTESASSAGGRRGSASVPPRGCGSPQHPRVSETPRSVPREARSNPNEDVKAWTRIDEPSSGRPERGGVSACHAG